MPDTPELLLYLFGVLNLADHATTNLALKHKGRELNPIMAKILAKWGTTGMFIFKMAAYAAIWLLHLFVFRFGIVELALLNAFYVFLVGWSLYQLRRTKAI